MTDDKIKLDKIRTDMANERTFLAYLRTALSLLAFGLIVLKFFSDNALLSYAGIASLLLGAGMFPFGIVLYSTRRKKFKQ